MRRIVPHLQGPEHLLGMHFMIGNVSDTLSFAKDEPLLVTIG